nr:EthD family reductase [Pseudonocardia alni]
MHVLTVAYGHPSDPAAFDDHYAATHSPLARSVPGYASSPRATARRWTAPGRPTT